VGDVLSPLAPAAIQRRPLRGRPPAAVHLEAEARSALERVARAATSHQRDALRARIVLAAGEGESTSEMAKRLGVSVDAVSKWRGRFARQGLEGLHDEPRSGRPARLTPLERCEIMALACEPPPQEDGLNGWTLDRLHAEVHRRGIATISRSRLHELLGQADLRPHKHEMWLHSRDPQFREKVSDVLALYLHPPEGETVLCIDEKTGMQALERKNPDRPAQPGRRARREFEYIRHGTQSLIASFDVRTGEVVERCGATRTGDDLESFMEVLAARTTGIVHVIWDNLNIHHGTRWGSFNARHGNRFRFHYTPLHASWLNQIELWLGILQRRSLARGSFGSVEALRGAVTAFVLYWNRKAKHPFRWSFTGYALPVPTEPLAQGA
jgi:transposase